MFTQYVEDTSHWEKWQQKYRFGVLLVFPPNPLFSNVNELRENMIRSLQMIVMPISVLQFLFQGP